MKDEDKKIQDELDRLGLGFNGVATVAPPQEVSPVQAGSRS